MARAGGLRNVLIWSYERGTLQYDIICALIIAFIFLVPRSCFISKEQEIPQTSSEITETSAPASKTSEAVGLDKNRN